MKKIVLLLSILVGLGLAINSCISEIVPDDEPPGPVDPEPLEPTKKTFYLRFNTELLEPITTYAYPNMGNTLTPTMLWYKDENVGVFMIGDNNATLYANRKYFLNTDNSAQGHRSALLADTLTTAVDSAVCYGYYPYQASVSGTTVSATLNPVQNQSADDSNITYMDLDVSDNLFLLSPLTNRFEISNGTGVFAFKSVFSILRFQVSKSEDNFPTFNSQRVKKFQLYIADKSAIDVPLDYNLAGEYTIDVSKALGSSGYQGPVFASGKGVNKITATVTGGGIISEYLTSCPLVYFIVNPITIKSNECLVSLIETDSYRIIDTCAITSFEANNVYHFDVKVKPTNTVSDVIVTTAFMKNEASNCYIIPRSGICQIPLFTTNGKELRGSKIDWLWASKENGGKEFSITELIDTASFVYNASENYIRFRVGTRFGNYTRGNVLLALKDATGQIVWSWHIWITDNTGAVVYAGNKEFLDRNIGAMSAEITSPMINYFGFVYQWGRKDPFMGGDGKTIETTALSIAENNTKINTNYSWSVNRGQRDTVVAKQNPMLFICYNNNSTDLNKPVDWMSGSSAVNRWSDTGKTDNDPCPTGYKVPSKADLQLLHDAAEHHAHYPADEAWYFKQQGLLYWEYYSYNLNKGRKTAWPAAGMRQGRNNLKGANTGALLTNAGTEASKGQCFYWTSSTIRLPDNTVGAHRIYTSDRWLASGVWEGVLYDEAEFGDMADAYPVRCIKMATP